MRRERRGELVAEALTSVGLADAAGAYPWQLSGGMQQRVAIARARAYEPEVPLMTEPSAAVDAQTRAGLEDLVRVLWRERGITVLFVTHDIDEAVYLGERVIVRSAAPPPALTTRHSAAGTTLRWEGVWRARGARWAARRGSLRTSVNRV